MRRYWHEEQHANITSTPSCYIESAVCSPACQLRRIAYQSALLSHRSIQSGLDSDPAHHTRRQSTRRLYRQHSPMLLYTSSTSKCSLLCTTHKHTGAQAHRHTGTQARRHTGIQTGTYQRMVICNLRFVVLCAHPIQSPEYMPLHSTCSNRQPHSDLAYSPEFIGL